MTGTTSPSPRPGATGSRPLQGAVPHTRPRWVTVTVLVAVVAVVAFVVLHLAGGGMRGHG
ncbi:hypothetical protein [Streptomyces chromofuscus]|uniref:Uncharacterized protein n=1 Tax=Streptomyces chromofuscus TaxID=42881 RepID=A0A7M2TA34_STRCW|nr:hypothetical protein [Streptomyces chromofuscus]QOV44805.1 hypothetical protein IPT68_01955 [Streptomyces chromofuscus]GGT00083.1 hypothetical protein GCM10010254_20140 [Streptomyces chromofuscus]